MISVAAYALQGCNSDFLDAKPSTSIVQPSSLDDFQGLLENSSIYYSPALPTLSADEYNFISYPVYLSASTTTERNAYIWAKDLFAGETDGGDWSSPFHCIFYSNNVIAGLDKIRDTEKDQTRLNFLQGWAAFNRAFAFYELVSNFSTAYDPATADTDPGIPLKLNPSVDDIQPRASVQQTYDQIIADLFRAGRLINLEVPGANRYHPSKTAVHALLARIYLSMRKYDLAELQADSSLQLYSKLIDYNTISPSSAEPFTRTNDELILRKATVLKYSATTVNTNSQISINPAILSSYENKDLRRSLYFRTNASTGAVSMKRMYNGATAIKPFTGLATDEVYLIKAECAARRGDLATALSYLNGLLAKRYAAGNFIPVSSSDQQGVLNRVLIERKKELIWRNIRWSDLKRLNKEGANITITRELNGITYELSPNSSRYVFPIPDDEISLSGIKQNQRD